MKSKLGFAELAFLYCLAVSVGACIVAMHANDIAKRCNRNYCKIYGHEYRDTQIGRQCWICNEREQ